MSTLPTSTTNITGLRIWRRGSSLHSESTSARRTSGGSKSGRAFARDMDDLLVPSRIRCSTIGPSASTGTNASTPTSSTTPTSQAAKSGVCVGSVPGPAGTIFLRASEPAIARIGIASQ